MNVFDIAKNTELRNRFIKDENLPIQITKDPYFDYFVDLFSVHFNSSEKWANYMMSVSQFETIEDFYTSSKKFQEDMINYISSKPEYVDFQKMEIPKFTNMVTKGDIYKEQNNGKLFVSIDLKQANFQSLKFANEKLVDGCCSYDGFAHKFSDSCFFRNCKKIRQIIFGNLNPSKQATIQKYLISVIINYLISKGISVEDIKSASNDEVVIEVSDKEKARQVHTIINDRNVSDGAVVKDLSVKIQTFEIIKMGTPKFSFFVKKDEM
ncbi:MAG: hypothetical protein RLY43_234, partial [Bacteroidota bacterium]